MLIKLYSGFTKFLHAHASGGGAALVLLLDKMAANAPLDRAAWAAIAAAYIGVGGLVSALPHGGKGAVEDVLGELVEDTDDLLHDDGTEDVPSDALGDVVGLVL